MSTDDLIIASQSALTGERAWAYALGAVYHAAHGLPVNALLPKSDDESDREMLARDWGITDRATLVQCLNDLSTYGHRHRNGAQLRYYALLWRPAVASLREEFRAAMREGGDDADDAAKSLWRLDAVQSNTAGIRSAPLFAFDAARAIMLVRDGLAMGWLHEQEAWAFMLDVARDAQRSYRSWSEYGADFNLARNVWAGRDCNDGFNDVVQQLMTAAASPWRQLAWEQPGLSVPRPVDAVAPADDAPVWSLEMR